MSTGAITFPLKLAEASNLYARNQSFLNMSLKRQQEFLMPFKVMDVMEMELKNLDIVNTSDQMSNSLRIVRRNNNIQKDFFSMAEYLVWAVNLYFELEYYKKRKTKTGRRTIALFD